MKQLFLFCLLFCIPYSAKAIGEYAIGDSLNVLALNGLILRDAPSGHKIEIISYGKKVVVLAKNFKKISYEAQEFKDFTIKGYWVAVSYGNKIGYVFDGFLSKFPIVKQKTMQLYIEKNFKEKGKIKNIRTCNDDTTRICATEQLFKEGFFQFKTLDSGEEYTFTFNKITMEEAYLLANIFYKNAEKERGNRKPLYTYLKKRIEISPSSDVGCYYTIYIENKKVILSEYCGC